MVTNISFQLEISGPDLNTTITLAPGVSSLGRVPGNTIVLGHPLVSRSHAQIECSADSCTITDLGSANGTLVNGNRLTAHVAEPLFDRVAINIGPFELRLKATEFLPPEPETPAQAEPQVQLEPAAPPEDLSVAVQEEPAKGQPSSSSRQEEAPFEAQSSGREDAPASQPAEPPEAGVEISRIMPRPVKEDSKASKNARKGAEGEPPQAPPEQPHYHTGDVEEPAFILPPGLELTSQRLIHYLPGIYQTDFMSRFLALFESILTPIEWNIDNFDLFLDPGTAPAGFLPWLANWYEVIFDSTWSESQRRTLLKEAFHLYARRGTCSALTRLLEIYTGRSPEIIEFDKNMAPYTFIVRLPFRARDVDRNLLIRLIDANKPSYTTYSLEFLK